jgi:hypothetical protein
MPTLFAELYDGEEDEDELYEKEDFEREYELEELDPDADEDEILCMQCGEVIDDGVQCTFCGWIREYVKPYRGDL